MYIQIVDATKKNDRKHLVLQVAISTLLIIISLSVKKIAASHPDMVEKYFSTGVFPVTSGIQTGFANLFPFSLYELFIVGIILFLAYKLFRLIQSISSGRFGKGAIHFLVCIYTMAAIILFLFFFLWNLNNYRVPLKDHLGLTVEDTTVSQLADTYQALVTASNDIRFELSLSQDIFPNREKIKNVLDTAWQGYPPLSRSFPVFHSKRVRVKGLFFSRIQTISGYTGVYSFLTGEPNINIEAPYVTLPHTACHEIAHQMGINLEDEANYAGFLACKSHPDKLFCYSGYLSALTYAGNALYRQSPDLYTKISSLLRDEIKNDQKEIRHFWDVHQKETAAKIADKMNEVYLKNNNQPQGLKSYGKFVDLLIADYLADGEI